MRRRFAKRHWRSPTNSGARAESIVPEPLVNLGLVALGQGEYERADGSLDEALAMSQKAGRKATVINCLEAIASLAGALEEASELHACGGPRRQHEKSPASLCHPPSGRYTSPTWSLPAPGSERGSGTKCWPRDRRCRSKRPPSTPSPRKRPLHPPHLCRKRPPAGEPINTLTRREEEVAVLVTLGSPTARSQQALDLRAHRRQPRRQYPQEAGTPFTGPDRHLGHRTRSAHPASNGLVLSAPSRCSVERTRFSTLEPK